MNEPLRHLDDEQMLLALYGAAAPETAQHLETCPQCTARFSELRARRAALLAAPAPPVDAARLRAQRDAIFQTIQAHRRQPVWRALQAGAVACSVLLAVLLSRPAPPPAATPELVVISDQQLFSEVAQMINRDTPAAAEPLMALFEPEPSEEAQQP
jgi:anti-sigma factor RsiW